MLHGDQQDTAPASEPAADPLRCVLVQVGLRETITNMCLRNDRLSGNQQYALRSRARRFKLLLKDYIFKAGESLLSILYACIASLRLPV
jgi:hypothetical protein